VTNTKLSVSPKLAVTYADSHDSAIYSGEMSWDELVETLSSPDSVECTRATCIGSECPHKTSSQMWGPIRFRNGADRKTLANVQGVSLLGVDVDHVPNDADLFQIYSRVFPWKHFVHATHSDRPNDRCIRIGLAVSREMTATETRRVREAVVQMLELPADKRARDPSRLYYAPTRPSDACAADVADGTGYLFAAEDGKILDVDAILAAIGPDGDEVVADYSEYVVPDFDGGPEQDKFEEAAKIMAAAWPDDDRHRAQLALAGALARAGWPVELITAFCARVAEIDQPGKRKHVELAPGAARASVEKVRTGEFVQGWPTVIEYCGVEAVQHARKLLGLDTMPEVNDGFARGVRAIRDARKQQQREATKAAANSDGEDSEAEGSEEPCEVERAPSGIELTAALRSAQKRLSTRKDADSLRDAELLKKVTRGEFLTDVDADRETALGYAALAAARAAPSGTTKEQLVRELLPSAGALAPDLAECVELAMEHATKMPSLFARNQRAVTQPDDEAAGFAIETTGPRIGRPANNSERNIRVALRLMNVHLQFNAFSEEEEIVRDGKIEVIDDNHLKRLRNEMERLHDFKPSKDDLWDTASVIARESSYHPVIEYLDEVDAVYSEEPMEDLTSTWLIRFAGAEDTPFVRAVSRLMLVAAVRRVRRPGCKFDEMLILETPVQGKSKSTALRALAVRDEWFTDDFKLQDDSKKMIEQTAGRWIIEAGELRGMSQGDHNAFKQYLSRRSDRARMSYDRKTRWVQRQFVLFGSTNDEVYLKDPTGNRRFWPIRVREFDVPSLLDVRDRLWAEASRLERENPEDDYVRLDPSLYAAAAEEQSKREIVSAFHVRLEDALDGAVGRVLVQDVYKLLGFSDESLPNRGQMMEIATVMQALKFESERLVVGGRKRRYYTRGVGPQREIPLVVSPDGKGGFRVREGGTQPTPRPAGAAAPSQSTN
jgi:predicted P-loop ATPase